MVGFNRARTYGKDNRESADLFLSDLSVNTLLVTSPLVKASDQLAVTPGLLLVLRNHKQLKRAVGS